MKNKTENSKDKIIENAYMQVENKDIEENSEVRLKILLYEIISQARHDLIIEVEKFLDEIKYNNCGRDWVLISELKTKLNKLKDGTNM